jgi:hypothetical protein
VPTIHRKSAGSRVLDLTRRLAEEYDGVPLREVRRAVREAAELVAAARTDTAESLTLIERIARDELSGLRAGPRRP